MAIKHIIRSSNGNDKEVILTPIKAIKYMCKECLGFAKNTEICTSPKCPLYPFKIINEQEVKDKELKRTSA